MDQQEPNNGVSVSMAQIIDQLHTRYTRMIGMLMQENAEQAAGLEALTAERNELSAQVQASQAANKTDKAKTDLLGGAKLDLAVPSGWPGSLGHRPGRDED